MTTHFAIDEYQVHKCYGVALMKPPQMKRDLATGGRTSRAARRLALFRLRRHLRQFGFTMISDVEYVEEYDVIQGVRKVGACARATDAPVPDGWRAPPSLAVVRWPRSHQP